MSNDASILSADRNPIQGSKSARYRFTSVVLLSSMILGGVLLVVAVLSLRLYKLPTPSMSPNIMVGDHILVLRYWQNIERGDVVIFDYPKDTTKVFIKRVVAVGGDKVELKDGVLIVNGTPVERKAQAEECHSGDSCAVWRENLGGRSWKVELKREPSLSSPELRNFELTSVPEGHVFLLGDNRDNSLDSRHFGTVPVDMIRGKPLLVYWSAGDEESVLTWERIGRRIE